MTRISRHPWQVLGFWLGMLAVVGQLFAFGASSAHFAYRLHASDFIGMESICAAPGSPPASGNREKGAASDCPVCGVAAGCALPSLLFIALLLVRIPIGGPCLPRRTAPSLGCRALRLLAARPPPLCS
ncbi:MAG: hypothetical protein WCF44_03100 [Candidatus Methylophosphatis roskildensis]